jgi:hypothetical protein
MIAAARRNARRKGTPVFDRPLKEFKAPVDRLGRLIGTSLPGGGGGRPRARKRSTVKTAAQANRTRQSAPKAAGRQRTATRTSRV